MFHSSFYFFSSIKKKMSCTKNRIKKRISYDATHNSHRNVIDLFMLVEGNALAYFCPIFPFGEVLCSYQLYVLECCTIEHTITNEKLFSLLYWKWVWLWKWCARHRQCGTHNRSGWIREYDWRRLCPQFCYFAFHRLTISCVCVALTHSLCSLHKTIRPACLPACLGPRSLHRVCMHIGSFASKPSSNITHNSHSFPNTVYRSMRFTHSLFTILTHGSIRAVHIVRTYIYILNRCNSANNVQL